MAEKVKKFIARFNRNGNQEQVVETFSFGCCFWFSYILAARFANDGAVIMYDEVINHFGTRVDGRVYDITGDVTDNYHWVPWSEISDDSLRRVIIRDCIMF